MARPAQMVGLVPVGFLAVAAAAAISAVLGGWTARERGASAGYGITPLSVSAPAERPHSGYHVDEVDLR